MPGEITSNGSQPEPRLELTEQQQQAWLDAIRENHSAGNRSVLKQLGVTVARTYTAAHGDERIRHAPPSKQEIDRYVAQNPDFRDDYLEARGYSEEMIRAEIARRAIEGVDEPVFWQGVQIGSVRRYSDRLLEFVARMHLPEARALQANRLGVEITGAGGGPVQVQQGVSLADVAAVLVRAGALPEDAIGSGNARPALPAASEVLAEPLQEG